MSTKRIAPQRCRLVAVATLKFPLRAACPHQPAVSRGLAIESAPRYCRPVCERSQRSRSEFRSTGRTMDPFRQERRPAPRLPLPHCHRIADIACRARATATDTSDFEPRPRIDRAIWSTRPPTAAQEKCSGTLASSGLAGRFQRRRKLFVVTLGGTQRLSPRVTLVPGGTISSI